MEFVKYQHIERLGTDEVDGITQGVCYVFPKIDGTNGSVWLRNPEHLSAIGPWRLAFGSRSRDLGGEKEDKDNQGFKVAVLGDERVLAYLEAHPTHRLVAPRAGAWIETTRS